MSQKISFPMGLDVGTSRLVVARQGDEGFQFESQLNAFVNIPFSKLTESVLKKERVPHAVENGQMVVYGNESERFAAMLNTEIRRPMTRGVLNPGEPDSVKLIREITLSLTGKAGQKGQKVYFTVPAAPIGSDENTTYHEATLQQVLGELGYEGHAVNEGLATVYAEMEDSNYSGIGISCGGGLCNVCLAYLSVPVMSFSVSKAGDFIDQSAASATGERANRIRILKEQSFYLNGASSDKLQQVLGVYYDDMIRNLVAGLNDAFKNARATPKLSRPVPLVLSGGSVMPKGFKDRFEKMLGESHFPIEISEVRMAQDPLTTTARGALVAAMCDN
jgi:hypothetical protein